MKCDRDDQFMKTFFYCILTREPFLDTKYKLAHTLRSKWPKKRKGDDRDSSKEKKKSDNGYYGKGKIFHRFSAKLGTQTKLYRTIRTPIIHVS